MHQIPQITALYCRLSKDDGRDGDSNSIASQKSILLDYAKSHAFYDTEFFMLCGKPAYMHRYPHHQCGNLPTGHTATPAAQP